MQQHGGSTAAGIAESGALMDRFRASSTAPNIFRVGDVGTNTGFPVQLSTTDPEDQKWALRKDIVDPNTAIVPGVGQAIAGDRFFDYAERKLEAQQLFEFQQFLMQQANLDSPAEAQWWFSKFPEMKDLRLNFVRQQAELQTKLAEIGVVGPQSKDDFLLLWMIENKQIVVSDKPLHKLNEKDIGTGLIADSYSKGMFSPLSQKIPATSIPARQHVPFNNPLAPQWGANKYPMPIPMTSIPGEFGVKPSSGDAARNSIRGIWTPAGR